MKKWFKRFVLLLVLTLVGFTNVSATSAPSQITIRGSKRYGGLVAGSYWNYKYTDDGTYFYCLDHHSGVPYNEPYRLAGELDAGFAYIIQNGYPNKSITGNTEFDHYITQGAIHWYIDRINGVSDNVSGNMTKSFKTTGSDPHGLRPHMRNLVENALQARNTGYVTPSGSITTNSSQLTASSDKTYYISAPITLTANGSIRSLSVSIISGPEGTVLVDGNGNQKTSFNNGDVFYVKVPASSLTELTATVKINMTGQGVVNKVYKYVQASNIHGKVQDIVMAKPIEEQVNFGGGLTFDLATNKTTISKVDITTEKELPGATLTIKDSSGNVVEQWVSTDKPHVIDALPEGKYTLEETIAPDGYIRAESIEFEVVNGKATTVVMKDDYTKLKISKIDITSKEELPGATLVIKDEEGNVVDEWVSTEEAHYIEKIKPGKYTLEETIAPDGYIRAEKIEFEVLETGDVQTVTMVDDYTKVEISKKDVITKVEVPGAKLKIVDSEGNTVKEWVSSDKPQFFEKLKVGKYQIIEVEAPDGYVLATEPIEFEVLETGENQVTVVYNTPLTPTPDTAFHVSTLVYIIAMVIGGIGIGVIYLNTKKKA